MKISETNRHVHFVSCVCIALVLKVLFSQFPPPLNAEEKELPSIAILSPTKWQVIQRRFDVPQLSYSNNPGGPSRGFADVTFAFQLPRSKFHRVEYRIKNSQVESPWLVPPSFPNEPNESVSRISIPIKSGGWYQVEWTFFQNDTVVAKAMSEPFGVGDVFLVAGQSYATNCNDEKLQVQDSAHRVVAFDTKSNSWQIANDPQPTPDGSDGGSIWPAVGDSLISVHDVPVGFVNVAVGATSTTNWDITGPLFERLVHVAKQGIDFRAVLWQQGESDVIEKTKTATYVERLSLMRKTANNVWGFERPWFLAKSTLHPTVYNDPEGEHRIRQAIETLIVDHGFERGPDTDKLDKSNRGPMGSRRHWSGMGQRNAAQLWFSVLHEYLERPRPPHETFVFDIERLHLLDPAWMSETVFHESSILLQDGDSLPTARLAFPTSADRILKVRNAIQTKEYLPNVDWKLSDKGTELVWIGPLPFDPLTNDKLYPPKDSPNSYQHRVGYPEQNLFYAPGKWFHQHNLEITYRPHQDNRPTTTGSHAAFPRVKELLASRRKLTIAVSGDSISTGLDASGTTATVPFQPGYPELVAAQLSRTFGSEIELVNRSVAGWSIANGVADLDNILKHAPDLLIVAYGMNDVGRRDSAWFIGQAKQIETKAKSVCPNAEILWVSPMLGNREWIHTPREQFFIYRDALKNGIAEVGTLADVTQVWEALLKNKHDLDLTGNGLNHPNDFGHRLYAQAILQLLITH